MQCIVYRCDKCGKVLSDEYGKVEPVADIHIHTHGIITIAYRTKEGQWREKTIHNDEAQWCSDCLNKAVKEVISEVVDEQANGKNK